MPTAKIAILITKLFNIFIMVTMDKMSRLKNDCDLGAKKFGEILKIFLLK
ncbi:hypothetical protein [Intestinibacter sp.]|nr:hypothetical protein [Intestinibacter sp.]MDY2736559.1 hypothetical protein [Intestinibacter sp.]